MKWLTSVTLLAALGMAMPALAADMPVVTRTSPIRLWGDQIGYRTQGRKIAVVASDKPLPDTLQIDLRQDQTERVVWKLADHAGALTKFDAGKQDPESGEYLAYLDFTGFVTPGRYFLALTAPQTLRSYKFNLAENPYRDAGLAAWKAYYYSRADGDKPEKYAGLWNHGKAFLGPGQAAEAKVYKWKVGTAWPEKIGTEVVSDKTYDVHGGWWDAGDMNKYTSNTVDVQNMLLMAYEMCQGSAGPRDNDLNIPESGNGIPDELDEIRVATEFLIRDNDGAGAAFGRVHMEPGSPPDSVKAPVQLTMPNSATTMARAAALAYAAVVWRESKLDDAFAKKCLDESLKSWNLLKAKPHPWPVDPKDPRKILSQGEMGGSDEDYARWRTMAAACYFRLNGGKEFDDLVHQGVAGRNWDKDQSEPFLWVYMHAKGADPAMVQKIKGAVARMADGLLGQVGSRGYRTPVYGYWWGSNGSAEGRNGGILILASLLTDDAAKKKAYADGAEEYVHYLFGRNPLGTCYFSNMKSFGAEHSVMVMFHTWVGNINSKEGQKYIGEGPGKIGPFPGYLIGGPQPTMKHLVEDLDWRHAPWEYTEPDIGYQSDVLRLLDAFTWPR